MELIFNGAYYETRDIGNNHTRNSGGWACCSNGSSGQCHNILTQICCGGQIYDWPENECCEDEAYNHQTHKCCTGGPGQDDWTCEIEKECCNGNCCDTANCQACDWLTGEECVQACDMFPCMKCDGQGNCVPCDPNNCESCVNGHCKSDCDPANCESCVNGHCKVCGGDPTKKCCSDGSCVKPCELEKHEGTCSGPSTNCPYRCDVCCDNYYKITWTGNYVYSCKEDGCPGDCQDDVRPICYTRTMCGQMALSGMMCYGSLCLAAPEGGGVCYVCMHGRYPVENFDAPFNKKCGQ